MSLEPGQVIDGKYRVVRMIGQGGMGAVFEGENTRISRRVAIKVLKSEAAGRPELAARFQREAQAAARIGSHHVCDVLDLGDLPNGDLYIVMELLDGQDLDKRLKERKKLPPVDLAIIAYQLLDGLATMHDAGIIHRDLKPGNVFLARAGRHETVKILDFGVSKFSIDRGVAGDVTATDAVMGTPLYMSPEQARGARDIDARSDLYSVGVMLYRALTGELPFKGDNYNAILFKVATHAPKAIEELEPDTDLEFAAIVRRAMARDQNARFQNAREFQDAVREWGTARGIAFENTVSIPPSVGVTSHSTPPPPPQLIVMPANPPPPDLDFDLSIPEGGTSTQTSWAGKFAETSPLPPIRRSEPPPAYTPMPRLADSLARENAKAARSSTLAIAVVAVLALGGGGAFLYTRVPSIADNPMPPASASEIHAATSPVRSAPVVLPTPEAVVPSGIAPSSLPLALPAPLAKPGFSKGAAAAQGAPFAPRQGAPNAPAQSASAVSTAKSEWGVIAPTIPTIEKPAAPAPAASPPTSP